MKILFKTLFVIMVFLLIGQYPLTFSQESQMDVNVTIDAMKVTMIDASTFIENGRTYVPIRVVLEAYGVDHISWESPFVSVEMGLTNLKIPVGKNVIFKNNIEIQIDAAAKIQNGRTYLPIRAVIEALGGKVGWDELNKTVLITKPKAHVNDFRFEPETGTLTSYGGKGGEVIIPEFINGVKVLRLSRKTFAYNQMITKVIMPDSIIEMEQQAFIGCQSLKSVRLSSSIQIIPLQTFWDCQKLEEVILPSNLKAIKLQSFAFCKSLRNIELPLLLEKIEYGTFDGCSSLESIAFPESFFEIQGTAFNGCTSLKTAHFSSEVIFWGGEPFYNCPDLTITSPLKEYYKELSSTWGYPYSAN